MSNRHDISSMLTEYDELRRKAQIEADMARRHFERIIRQCDSRQDPRKPIASWVARLRAKQCRKFLARLKELDR